MEHDGTGIVIPSQQFENHDTISISTILSTVINNAIGYQLINFSELLYRKTLDIHLADFKILTPEKNQTHPTGRPSVAILHDTI